MRPDQPVQLANSNPTRDNLPAPLTTLVGRDSHITEVKRLLQSHRLVALTGAGGVGKTRIALKVASDLAGAEAYPDGVWLVELAGLADPKLLPQAIARVVRANESERRPLEETIEEALEGREILLVIDNCEHLIEACARLIRRLLSNLPHLVVLATSREALGIPGEIAWGVPSLGVPPNGASTLSSLIECASVQLLLERACAMVKDFGLTSANADAVAAVCRRLEGIPLALELAAARLAVLTPEQLAERLGNVLPLLVSGNRTADFRQQTLRATIDWSYQLLSEHERTLFRRCAVFAGGWSIGAAEAVCSGESIDRAEVLNLMGQLVSKSLILAEEHGPVERYRMLEPIRQFAAEQLLERVDAEVVRNRHLAWLVDLSERGESGMWGPDQLAWLERLESEGDNFRAALEWSHATGQHESMLRLGAALARFWDVHGYLTEGANWLAAAIEATPSVRSLPRAQALARAGYLAILRNDLPSADLYLPEALALAQELGDDETIGAAHLVLSMAARARGDYRQAVTELEESLEMSRRAGHRPGVYTSLYLLATVARLSGNDERAIALHQESLALKREHGDLWGIAVSLFSLGTLALKKDPRRAGELYRESLVLRTRLRDRLGICVCLEALAGLAAGSAPAHAAVLLGAAEQLRETMRFGDQGRARTDELVASLVSVLGPAQFAAYRSRGGEMGLDQVIEEALNAHIALACPDDADNEKFQDLVKDALQHLNNPLALRQHPLLRKLSTLIGRDLPDAEAAAVLQGELRQAIERLQPLNTPRPAPGTRSPTRAWLHYLVLHESCVEGRTIDQIRNRWSLSERTTHRIKDAAIEAVALDLAQRTRRL